MVQASIRAGAGGSIPFRTDSGSPWWTSSPTAGASRSTKALASGSRSTGDYGTTIVNATAFADGPAVTIASWPAPQDPPLESTAAKRLPAAPVESARSTDTTGDVAATSIALSSVRQ